MKIPNISAVKIPNLGNSILEIMGSSGFKKKSLTELEEMYHGNACKYLGDTPERISFCGYFWNGILSQGIEQVTVKTGTIVANIMEELNSVKNNKFLFEDLIKDSTFILFELFIEFYYQKAFRVVDDIFWALRRQKLQSIIKIIKTVLIWYIILYIFLSLLLLYFIYSSKRLFDSFLNFIGIVPMKYLVEDTNFYNEIIRIGQDYF